MRALRFGLALAMGASAVHAADKPDARPFMAPVAGVGTTTCGDFVKYRRTVPLGSQVMDNFSNWAQGFIAAYNLQSNYAEPWTEKPVISNIPVGESMLLYMEKFCVDNPLDTVFDATVNLVNQSGGYINWRSETMKVHGPVPRR